MRRRRKRSSSFGHVWSKDDQQVRVEHPAAVFEQRSGSATDSGRALRRKLELQLPHSRLTTRTDPLNLLERLPTLPRSHLLLR